MKKALLVIDAQNIYTNPTSGYYVEEQEQIIGNINRLIEILKKEDSLIVYIAHKNSIDGSDSGRMYDYTGEVGEVEFVDGSDEVEYDSSLLIVDGMHLTKHKYDAFVGTDLYNILKNNGVEKVVITGFMTNFCCESTARTAHDLDFFVDFVKDAMGTPGTEECSPEELTKATCSTIENGFGNIVMTEDYL